MKTKSITLLKKASKNYLLFGLSTISFSLILLYFSTKYIIDDETDEGLYSSSYRIEQLLANNKKVVSLSPFFEVNKVVDLKPLSIKDTLIYDILQNENELFRELNTFKKINETNYKITVRTLVVESEDIILLLFLSYAIIILILYVLQYYNGKQVNKLIWMPFFKNLDAIKKFSVYSNHSVELVPTDIIEFAELNDHILSLTTKVKADFENLKHFTENVSHEIQTPLAIIQVKSENLIDNIDELDEKSINIIYEIQKNVKRLSKLNKGLILLTKIDNEQYYSSERININLIIEDMLKALEDIVSIKKFKVNFPKKEAVHLSMNSSLADILISNLIGNAVKYTSENGSINIEINKKSLIICNSGDTAILEPEKIFHRYHIEGERTQSLGLGLAIVKKICNYYDYKISYSFGNGLHCYRIDFQ